MNMNEENPDNLPSRYTYREIAASRALWDQYVDPQGLTTDDGWDAGTVEERIAFIEMCFGKEGAQ